MSEFQDLLDRGAAGSELFEYRNRSDSDSADISGMNDDLRSVGCFLSSSERTD